MESRQGLTREHKATRMPAYFFYFIFLTFKEKDESHHTGPQ